MAHSARVDRPDRQPRPGSVPPPQPYPSRAVAPVPDRSPAPAPTPQRIPVWRDIYNGAVLGDFARQRWMAGAITQISLSFLPLVGTVCALRDCLADIRYRDVIGFCLNLLALTPIVGGIPKTLDVTRSVWHMGHIIRRSRQARAQAIGASSASYTSYAPAGHRVKPGLFALSLLTILLLAGGAFAFLRTSTVVAMVCGGPQVASCTMNIQLGAGLALVLGLSFMALAWIAGLVQAAFRGNWGWFFGVMLLNPLSTLLYSLVGPR